MQKEKLEIVSCERLEKDVTIRLNGIIVDDTFIPSRYRCEHQQRYGCDVYQKADVLCPPIERLREKYTSRLGPSSA